MSIAGSGVRLCGGGEDAVKDVCLLLVACIATQAQAEPAQALFDSVAVGADHNLRELPGRIVVGDLAWEKSYFNALGLRKTGEAVGQRWKVLQGTPLAAILQGHELVLVQHHGMQDNAEVGAAYTLRTHDLELGAAGVNFATGVGLSYALGTPSYEDGPLNDPGKCYRLQLLLLFDLEWKLHGYGDWSLVTRVHHRSGVYGLISPSHVGSNFLALGIRYKF